MTNTVKITKSNMQGPSNQHVVPCSPVTNWVNCGSDPESADGSPYSVVESTIGNTRIVDTNGIGATLLVRLRYTIADTITTDPVIQAFGLDSNSLPQKLFDSADAHELTLVTAAATDVQDGTYAYTDPVEVDMEANTRVYIAVKTAVVGASAPQIQVRSK